MSKVPTELDRARNLAWWLRDALDKPFVGSRDQALQDLLDRAANPESRVDESIDAERFAELRDVDLALRKLRGALNAVLRDCQAPVASLGEVRGG